MQNEIILDVEGMTCGHCKASVENAVSALEGVGRVEADLDSQQVCVVYDPAKVKVEDIKQAITAQGYHVA
ncbi:MAG: hypothetical protein CVU89_06480 [Firmicutes bacterium HGW-Firmicutes-14]|nr:MAG: hypothetical protein CVU89_06480 [Firmicutes bacterium HGW-Firmicutes-14]